MAETIGGTPGRRPGRGCNPLPPCAVYAALRSDRQIRRRVEWGLTYIAMPCIAIATAIGSLLVTGGSWSGQSPTSPTLTIADIVTKIGSEVDARAVLITVLTHAMASGSKREFFLASQVRNEWLPPVRGVEFVRLADAEISGHLAGCGTYWLMSNVQRNDNVVSLVLSQRCGGTSLGYIASLGERGWWLGPPGNNNGGWAPGIGSGLLMRRPPACPYF